jgi:hypothetical protein
MARRTGNMVLDALLAANPTARAFDRALENTERNTGPVTLMGGESAADVDPKALYKSSYKQAINPGASKAGTCDYCLRSNGRVFRGADIIMQDGTVGHHPNCKCIFTLTQSPVSNGVYTGADFGARKQLRTNSNALDGVATSDLRVLAQKRGLRSRGITNDALRKSILKSYMK